MFEDLSLPSWKNPGDHELAFAFLLVICLCQWLPGCLSVCPTGLPVCLRTCLSSCFSTGRVCELFKVQDISIQYNKLFYSCVVVVFDVRPFV